MEKFFVLIALAFAGISEQADGEVIVTFKNQVEFMPIFYQCAGDDENLDFAEFMVMTAGRILRYVDFETNSKLDPEDKQNYRTLLQRPVQTLLYAFVILAQKDMKISEAEVKDCYGNHYFLELFQWTPLHFGLPPKSKDPSSPSSPKNTGITYQVFPTDDE